MHLEVINLLLVMLSTQLYSPSATAEPGGHPFTEVLMDAQDSAIRMLLVLLQHFSERRSLPANAPVYRPPIPQQGGVLRLVKSAAGKEKRQLATFRQSSMQSYDLTKTLNSKLLA